MLTKMDIQSLIDGCREAGEQGLGNHTKATIPELTVDFLTPPADFLGVKGNPAIFVNHETFSFLGKFHPSWQKNQTIAVKEEFLKNRPIVIIGVIVHETGHAFNVAAGIANSEANAYIFEIEILYLWLKTKSPWLFSCSKTDVQSFLRSRLPFYCLETSHNPYLATLVKAIETNTMFDAIDVKLRFTIPTPKKAEANPTLFFKEAPSSPTPSSNGFPRCLTAI